MGYHSIIAMRQKNRAKDDPELFFLVMDLNTNNSYHAQHTRIQCILPAALCEHVSFCIALVMTSNMHPCT